MDTILARKMLRFLRNVPRVMRGYCTSSKDPANSDKPFQLPEKPTNCCMSGCANCVWIDYAKELTRIYSDGGSKAQKVILEKISDPSLKIFLQMELKALGKSKPA